MESAQLVTSYSSRTVDLEPDTVAICEAYPGYLIIGTYSLVEDAAGHAVKKGSVEIHHFDTTRAAGSESLVFCERFPIGVYDIHFHPERKTLLGIATSNAELLFYRFAATPSEPEAGLLAKLIPLGKITAEPSLDSNVAIITQFQFVSSQHIIAAVDDSSVEENVFLAATTQFGNTKLLRVTIRDGSDNLTDVRDYSQLPTFDFTVIDVHKQSMDLEAWTVCAVPVDSGKVLFVSGGDDSQMIGSTCDISVNEPCFPAAPVEIFTEKRSHAAGVVSLLSLGRDQLNDRKGSFLLLSGSYDEHLRLFALDANTLRPVLKNELRLPGGVWRISLLDEYATLTGRDYVLLIAAHLGGAFVVRLTGSKGADADVMGIWTFVVEAEFTAGHKSLVYACGAVCSAEEKGSRKWSVVSTSFYDKQVCQWEWADSSSTADP